MGIIAGEKSRTWTWTWVCILGCVPLLVIILLGFKIFMGIHANKQLQPYVGNQGSPTAAQQPVGDTQNLLYMSAESMFSEVLKVPSKEGLVFMQVYADAIEDDKVTAEEYKALQKIYSIFAESRPQNAVTESESSDAQFNELDGQSAVIEDLEVGGEH